MLANVYEEVRRFHFHSLFFFSSAPLPWINSFFPAFRPRFIVWFGLVWFGFMAYQRLLALKSQIQSAHLYYIFMI